MKLIKMKDLSQMYVSESENEYQAHIPHCDLILSFSSSQNTLLFFLIFFICPFREHLESKNETFF